MTRASGHRHALQAIPATTTTTCPDDDEYEPNSDGEDLSDCESSEYDSEDDIDDMFYESYE